MKNTPKADTVVLQLNVHKQDYLIARLAALAIVIHVLESLIPSPIPGIKPGFANIITLVVFLMYGVGSATWVSLLRVLVGSLVIGSFLSPTFVLSISGALFSLAALVLCTRLNSHIQRQSFKLSIFGIAILMSLAHMFTQFVVVYIFFIPHQAMLDILPIMLMAALVFGALNGLIADKVYQKMEHRLC